MANDPEQSRQRSGLTKPAGVFVQLLGAGSLIVGLLSMIAGFYEVGIVGVLIGLGLLWVGGQPARS